MADLLSPLFSLDVQARLPKISTSHLPERFGLLIILTLGEIVVSSINGVMQLKELSWLKMLISTESLLITFLVWWLYVDHVLYRVFKPKLLYALSWCYLHLPLSLAIIALSACINMINTTTGDNVWAPVAAGLQWQVIGFVALILLSMTLLNLVSESHDHHHQLISFHSAVERGLAPVQRHWFSTYHGGRCCVQHLFRTLFYAAPYYSGLMHTGGAWFACLGKSATAINRSSINH